MYEVFVHEMGHFVSFENSSIHGSHSWEKLYKKNKNTFEMEPYSLSNEAEFFAACFELYYNNPQHLKSQSEEIYEFIDSANCLVRPINLPEGTPGVGVRYVKVNQEELAIINVLGSVFMGPCIDPFQVLPDVITQVRQRTPHIFIDFHAETTSEKQATGWLFDGQVSAVVGTHTHVQTNDARILPKGTGYMSDVGMTGALNSIIGFRPSDALKRFVTQLPQRLTPEADGPAILSGVFIETDSQTGLVKKIEPIRMSNSSMASVSKRKFD